MSTKRRDVLVALAACLIVAGATSPACAKDGGKGRDGGHDDNGHDDDGGHDDGREKNRRDEDDGEFSQDDVLREVRSGRIIPLRKALGIVNNRVRGKVIDVDLTTSFGRPQYRMKVRGNDGAVTTIRLDARTGKFLSFLGF